MSVSEYKIPHLNNAPPKFKKIQYPIPIKGNIQKPYYCCCSIGVRGSGKTYSVVKMLKNQEESGFLNPETNEKTAIRHILFTSTLGGNPIWTSLKYLDEDDIHEDYSNQILEDILEDMKEEREYTKRFKEYVVAYKKYEKMTPEQYSKWKDKEAIILLMSHDFAHYKDIQQPKYPNGVVNNIIFDDMLASDAFSKKKNNTVLKLVLNGRHYASNCFILSQHIKSIPKPIRENTEVWSFFPFKSKKMIIDHLYELFGNLVTEEDFITLYEYATKNPHDSLVVDLKEEKEENRFKLNFDKIIRIE
jgi:hypothetical protein